MYSDALILRTVVQLGLTTKGSELTAEELDGNFIALWQDLKQRLSAGNLDPYSSVKAYAEGDAVSYADNTWLNVSPTGSTGTEPGSDEDVWLSIPVEQLAHQRNKDTKLDEGGDFEVSAEDIRALIDGGGGNFFTADLTATADRSHSAAGFGVSVGNLSHWWLNASAYAPTLGRASFEQRGYGSGGGDVIVREENGVGAVIRESYGNKDQRFYGDTYIQIGKAISFNGSIAYINKSGGSNGIEIFVNGAGHVFGWSNGQQRSTGNLDTNSIEHVNTNVDSYFAQSNGSYQWQYGKTGNDGAIRGNIGAGFSNTELVKLRQSDGAVIFSNSVTKHNGLSTTEINALTAEDGMLVYNTTIAHFCARIGGVWVRLSHSPM